MLQRYFSGSLVKPEERLLAEIQADVIEEIDYAALHAAIQKYPVDTIRQCCDDEGNNVLHLVLQKNTSDPLSESVLPQPEKSNAQQQSPTRAVPKRSWSLRPRGKQDLDPAANRDALENLLHFFIHEVYPEMDGDFSEHLIDDNLVLQHHQQQSQTASTRYNSLVRLPSLQDGRLPLHTACANSRRNPWVAQVAIDYLIAAYPVSVQCADAHHNVPLHCAAAAVAPLDVLQRLVRQHPESVKSPNQDGNLPLHLAAASLVYKEEGPLLIIDSESSSRSPARRRLSRRTLSNDESMSSFRLSSSPVRVTRRSMSNDEGTTDFPPSSSPRRGVRRNITSNLHSLQEQQQEQQPQESSSGSGAFTFATIASTTTTPPPPPNSNSNNTPSSRGVARHKSGPPPAAAFQRKPLSRAAVHQRDVVQFLVDCWPESVHVKNALGQTPEDCATASAVVCLLQEFRGKDVVKKDENSLVSSPLRRGKLVASPSTKEKFGSSFRLLGSPTKSSSKIFLLKTTTTPISKQSAAAVTASVEESSSPAQACTVIG